MPFLDGFEVWNAMAVLKCKTTGSLSSIKMVQIISNVHGATMRLPAVGAPPSCFASKKKKKQEES